MGAMGHDLTLHCRQLESLIKDNVVFTILSERSLGPKLHAVFAEGRLEEYVPSRSVSVDVNNFSVQCVECV